MAVKNYYYDRYIPTARELKEELQKYRTSPVKATLKDIQTMIDDNFRVEFIHEIDDDEEFDYSDTFETKLYNEHGGEYCNLLEIMHPYKKDFYDWYRK